MAARPGTPPRVVDVTQHFPELAEYARFTTRLHPRQGEPKVYESSIGGPLLWPSREPWPTCTTPWWSPATDNQCELHRVPNPLVAVLQLFAADAPTISFPPGTDLLQVLWCPVTHTHLPGQDDAYAPAVTLIWRAAAVAVRGGIVDPPSPYDADDTLVPKPCVLHPEQVLEYSVDLPDDLWQRVARYGDWGGVESFLGDGTRVWYDYTYESELSVAPGTKAGGWPRWHAKDPYPMPCGSCDRQLELLITFDSTEGDKDWNTDVCDSYWEGTGLTLGRGGDLQIFYCPTDPTHPHHVVIQG